MRERGCKAGETTRRPFVSILFHFPNRPDKIHVVVLTVRKCDGRLSVVQHDCILKRVFGSGFVRVFGTGEGRDCSATKEGWCAEKKKGRCACLIQGCVFGKSGAEWRPIVCKIGRKF